MNVKNIADLARQLERLGFEKIGYSLLKRICFKPGNFSLSPNIEKGNDRLRFQIYFEKHENEDKHFLMFYNAILQKGIVYPDNFINGINPADLAEQMSAIDWQKAFTINDSKPWNIEDAASWEKEKTIETIIDNLSALDKTQEGNAFAVSLRLRYWVDIPFPELLSNLSLIKAKSEVSQRFYFFEGQPGISVDEAYRYLQNKWIEKSMQIKRKQPEEIAADKSGNESPLPRRDLLKKNGNKRKLAKSKTTSKSS